MFCCVIFDCIDFDFNKIPKKNKQKIADFQSDKKNSFLEYVKNKSAFFLCSLNKPIIINTTFYE